MKISSKSLLSPGRAGVRDPPTSLSTSLNRRLKNSGSVKGGASPAMFPTTVKKRGAFENPEPSSPKVTCIGQVRVRGKKKQAKKLRTLSRRHSGYSDRSAGEVSFRKVEHPLNGFCSKGYKDKESLNLGPNGGQNQSQSQSQNQECSQVQRSWVHFPVTICEALRAFGSEFSCLIPCRTERGKEEKMVAVEDGNRQGTCGAVFARWLVAVQDGDGGGERDIELVVGDEDEEDDEEVVVRKRRHVFEDLEIVNGRIEWHKDEARVSVCVPPENALLLMRCRSDPMKSEALVNRSWEPTVARNEEEDEEFFDSKNHIENDSKKPQVTLEVEQQQVMVVDQDQEQENMQHIEAKQYQEQNTVQGDDNVHQAKVNQDQELNVQQDGANQDQELNNVQQDGANQDQELDNVQKHEVGQDQEVDNVQKDEVGQDQEVDNVQKDEVGQDQEVDNVQKDEVGLDLELDNVQQYEMGQDQEYEQTEVEEESFYLVSFEEIMNQDYEIQEQNEANEEEEEDDDADNGAEAATMVTEFAEISETHEEEMVNEVTDHNNEVLDDENEVKEKRVSEEVLPDCLLKMMHEPKLSINVSKETWVCKTDFIRRNSDRRKPPAPPPPIKPEGGNESSVGATTTVNDVTRVCDREFPTVLQQPARSSCSLPVAPSMATVLEQKLANAVGYEPFVLTRCKSEPMKTAASKLLLPESCVWETRKLEGLSRVTFGLGF